MLLYEYLRVGWTVIRAHKFRSALTVLSIAIGTFSIVLMSSLASSATATLFRSLEELGGANLLIFIPKSPQKAERKQASYLRGLTRADGEALRGRIPNTRHYLVFDSMGRREVTVPGAGQQPAPAKAADLIAANQDFFAAWRMSLAAGRPIDADDLAGRRRVAVLGHGLSRALFASPEQALGQVVRAGTESFRVVGVTRKVVRSAGIGFDWNDFVVTPLTTAPPDARFAMVLVTDSSAYNGVAKHLAAAIVSARHNQVDDFVVVDCGKLMDKLGQVFGIMQLIMGLIAGIALLVGGIGVMNILLVSVRERVREIGVRKAIGASDRAVGLQFLFESALLSGLGGTWGALLGCAAALLAGAGIRQAADMQDWVSVISRPGLAAAVAASLLIGLVFGLVPARRASRMQVVDCLRAAG
jgi:putative ABC transport system permease protein